MTSIEEAMGQVWLKPRRTIETVLNRGSGRGLWLLASLNAMSNFAMALAANGLAKLLLDWRILLGAAAASVVGIAGLYISSFIFAGIGRMLRGRASADQLRSALAWSAPPAILGFFIALILVPALVFLGGRSLTATDWTTGLLMLIMALCDLWSVIVFALMLSRVEGFGFWRTFVTYTFGTILGTAFSAFIAIAIRTLLFQPFSIPGASMVPTVLVGDYIFVSKYSYGYTHYSIPFAPHWFSGRIFASEPARGDVVAFRVPRDDSAVYVKRVVGLPGDRIQVKQGALYINDAAVKRERLADFVGGDSCGEDPADKVKRWRETLPNGVSYEVLDCVDTGFYDNTGIYEVPAGQFFMMGDNRDNSSDSRAGNFGTIPLDYLIGRAAMIYFSVAPASGRTPSVVRSGRMGQLVH